MRGAVLIAAVLASSALFGCGQPQAAHPAPQPIASTETPTSESVAQLANQLNPCEENPHGFIQKVCANQSLAALNSQISTTLAHQAASISEQGAEAIKEAQEQWRDGQRIACGITSTSATPSTDQQHCLEDRFRARAQEAASVIQNLNGYRFQRMELFGATPNRQAAAGTDAATTSDIRFPRIDGAASPQAQRFNALVTQRPQFSPSDGANETVRYRIVYAGPDLISVRFDMSSDTPSTGQTTTTVKAVNVLMASGRALTAVDVFRAGSGWEDFLTQRAVRDIGAQFRDYQFTPPERDVHETATKPHLWLITDRALVLLFPPLSFGGSADMAGAEVTIPWADLRPYLNPQAPAPIRAQA